MSDTMPIRRTPNKGSSPPPTNSSPMKKNGHHQLNGSSPSPFHDGKPKPKRSCLDTGRLCLLRNRGKRCWCGLMILVTLVAGSTFAIMAKMEDPTEFLLDNNTRQQRLRMAIEELRKGGEELLDNNTLQQQLRMAFEELRMGSADRVLYNDVSLSSKTWNILTGNSLFRQAEYQAKPRMMGFLLVNSTRESLAANYNVNRRRSSALAKLKKKHTSTTRPKYVPEQFQVARINPHNHRVVEVVSDPSKPALKTKVRKPSWSFQNILVRELGNGVAEQKEIAHNSKDYDRYKPDDTEEGCVPQYDWQTLSFPNCNSLHETDILTRMRTLNQAKKPESKLLASGGYRDVWLVENNDLPPDVSREPIAMKTLLYEHPWSERNQDRHRRDALATDRLTGSPYALNLYGYCANTGLYEFAAGGSLEDVVDDEDEWKKWTPVIKMVYAYQVANAIADVHNIDREGHPSMSHTDISMSQFVSTDDGETYQINDFNRARFLYRAKDDPNELCPFHVSSNKGKFRSPEEYAYEPETAAIDNYSMGNIFYVILTGQYPFEDMKKKDAMEAVKEGKRQEIPEEYMNSKNPMVKALVKAILKCWDQDPSKRATSRQIQQLLKPLAEKAIQNQQEKLKAERNQQQEDTDGDEEKR
ncbi:activated protein kinase kinase kinase 7 [Seminavis robusta]|uniref:Activated protein kinase kinase kinase 7 n=1 Tax=Seminavis robusta TaxID=568900 RepID=A0A9N8HJS3_9STRA|nr:activated protein kinase kinase kinase 7 [Seminavis robusta]|eukprot:Sro708_g190660.1 activated protein kinase kinase kinase 7 (641) ;mRNA; f:3015-5041